MSRDGRLGVYVENAYLVEEGRVLGHSIVHAFTLFACEVGARFGGVTFFGRTQPDADRGDYHPLPPEVELVELPPYQNLRRVGELLRAVRGASASVRAGLDRVDVVWVLGPHPFSFVVLALALRRRKRVVLGVRQDTVRYYRSRMRDRRWLAALPVVWAMDAAYRLLSRRLPTTVVGAELERRYGGSRAPTLAHTVSLLRSEDVAAGPRDWTGEVELLTVARIEPEKNPLLLVDTLAELERERPGRFRLVWAGDGQLEEAVRARAATTGVARRLELRGFVPFGPGLVALYRRAHVFVHVALTEGVPQAVLEALASGTPVIATDVGGVRAALAGGEAALLVPPEDRDALVEAVLRIADDADLRARLVARGLEVARAAALEVEAERVARFLSGR